MSRRASGARAAMAVGAILALWAGPVAAEPVGDPPIRFPDMQGAEAGVVEQLAATRRRLDEALAAGRQGVRLAEAYGDLGKLFHAYSFWQPAEDAYRNAARAAPDDYRWHHYLGVIQRDAGRLDEALASLTRAAELAPHDAAAFVYLGEIHRAQGRLDLAAAAAERALAAAPGSASAQAILGQIALERGDHAAAVRLLEGALVAAPEASRLHYPLANAYRGLGSAAKASEHLAQAGQGAPPLEDPLLLTLDGLRLGESSFLVQGEAAFRAGRWAEAAAAYERAVAENPSSPGARTGLAAALAELGRLPEAIEQLRQVALLAPDNVTARFNLGVLLAAGGSPVEAVAHLQAVVAARPEDAEARRELAGALRGAGRLPDALVEYRRAVELDPGHAGARLGEADALVRLGRFAEARTRLEESVKALPGDVVLAHRLARLLAASPDAALRDGRRALELASAVQRAHPAGVHAETVAMALAELGRCAEAATWQATAIEEARRAGPAERVGLLEQALAGYTRGAPCRPPTQTPAANPH
jgi:tetratricopeptide (TPR) repeat protein